MKKIDPSKSSFLHKQAKIQETQDNFSNMNIALLLMDTSWRVAIPILGLTLLGHYVDERTNHKILFILIGLGLSIVVTVLLVYRQLCIVFPDQFGKDNNQNKKGSS